MKYIHYAKVGETCPCCGQGTQFVSKETASGNLFVSCDDCFAEWETPDKATSCDLATRDKFGSCVYLHSKELIDHPWYRYVLNK